MSEFTPTDVLAAREREVIGTHQEHGWCSIYDEHDPYYVHVIPLNDKRKHSEDHNIPCWCESWIHPEEEGDQVVVLVHCSADGREFSEPDYEAPAKRTLQ